MKSDIRSKSAARAQKNAAPVVVILAGGKGTRFWPLSRQEHPKQFLPLYSKKSLLEETMDRARRLTDDKRVFIATGGAFKKKILERYPRWPADQFIVEPLARNTAPVLVYAALEIQRRFGDTPLVVLSADHYIARPEDFVTVVERALRQADAGRLVTIGISVSRPETNYGYLEKGKKIAGEDGVYELSGFKEKPDSATAQRFRKSKKYLWNAGIFVWRTTAFLAEARLHCPEIIGPMDARFPFDRAGDLRQAFELAPANSIDYALMEKSANLACVEGDFGWDDVGSWPALPRMAGQPDGGYTRARRVAAFDPQGQPAPMTNLVYAPQKTVVLLGVENLVVVEDGDVLFIADTRHLDGIKPMLDAMGRDSALRGIL